MVDTLLLVPYSTREPEDDFLKQKFPKRARQFQSKSERYREIRKATVRLFYSFISYDQTKEDRGETHPNYYDFCPDKSIPISPQVPVLVGYLEKYGLSWVVMDHLPANFYSSFYFLPYRSQFFQLLNKYHPRTIGISVSNLFYDSDEIEGIAQFLKELLPTTPLIVGGNSIRVFYPEFLSKGIGDSKFNIDIFCVSEGEEIYPQIVAALKANEDLSTIPGISFKKNNFYTYTHEADVIDLDTSLISQPYNIRPNITSMFIETVRGCPYRCAFCQYPYLAPKYRIKSAERVYKEFQLAAKHSVNNMVCLDSTFSIPISRVRELCHLIINNKIPISWMCYLRTEDIDNAIAELMSKAGCRVVYIGVESVNPSTLRLIGKKIDLNRAKEAIKVLRQNGITIIGSFIVGLPGDTSDTYKRMIEFIAETEIDIAPLFGLVIYPGTPFYNTPEKYGLTLEKRGNFSTPYWSHKAMDFYDAAEIAMELEKELIINEIACTKFLANDLFKFFSVAQDLSVSNFRKLSKVTIAFQKNVYEAESLTIDSTNMALMKKTQELLNNEVVRKYYNVKTIYT